MSQSDCDLGPDLAPQQGDLDTASVYGKLVAAKTVRFMKKK
jgi:hypothetical protein